MSRKLIGIGVGVAAVAASVVVGGYVMRDPVRPVQSAAPASLSEPQNVIPAPEPVPQVAPAAPAVIPPPRPRPTRVVRTATASPPPAPVPVETPAVVPPTPPSVEAPPAAAPAAILAPRYVPDPAPSLPPAPAPEPEPQFEEVTVERHAVIGIRLDYAVSTRTAKVEDRISATVTRNVLVNERVAIPEGARLEGTVTTVDRGGKFRDRPRLGLQFDTMILTDGTRMSIRTDAIVREGDSPSADAAAKVGAGSAVGAILGGLLGGKKGAIIGGAAGAASGTAAVMHGDDNETALKAGAPLTVRLTDDVTVIVRKQ